jgi:hypothetical protein
MNNKTHGIQIPGQFYTFVRKKTEEKLTCLLPEQPGVGNAEVYWIGTCWAPRSFQRKTGIEYRQGRGSKGLLGRMQYLLTAQKRVARIRKHEPPKVNPPEMLLQWNSQCSSCVICGGPLELLKACYDHNHETGEGRGFTHTHCNLIEGYTLPLSDCEFERMIEFLRKIRMNKSSSSYSVYLENQEAAKSGVTAQKEVGGQSYPGRAVPKAEEVKEAKVEKGAAVRCAKE